MVKQVLKGQAGLLAVAAVTFCGATLYGAGKLLEYLFKDVDPEKLEEKLKETEAKLKAADASGSAGPVKTVVEEPKRSGAAKATKTSIGKPASEEPKKAAAAKNTGEAKKAEAGTPKKAAAKPKDPKGDKKMIEVYCYDRCTTCKKALAWLDEKGIEYETIDIQKNHPNRTKLKKYHKMSGLPLKRFFNTSGKQYREMGLSQKLKDLPQDEQFMLLASDGMLVKRPLLVGDDFVLVGFKEAEWEDILLG